MDVITTSVVSFFSWWKHALLACSPSSIRSFLLPPKEITIITSYENELFYFHTQNPLHLPTSDDFIRFQDINDLGDLKYRHIILLCPDTDSFELPIAIPIDEATNMHQYLRENMHSFTPYDASQLCYTVNIIRTNPAAERIELLLRAIPTTLLDKVKNQFADLGMYAHSIALHTSHIAEYLEDIVITDTSVKPKKRFPIATFSLACLGLLFISEVYSLTHKNQKLTEILDHLKTETRSYQNQVQEIENLNTSIENLITEQNFYIEEHNISLETLNILAELSDQIPDDTWLTEFTKDKYTITISGYTENAATILNLINSLPKLTSAKFASPTNFDQRLKKEKFSITFILSPQTKGEESNA